MCPIQVANTDAENKRIQNETPAEADVGRIRCYQDQWRVHGSDLSMTRIFYQSQHCENPIGKIDYEKSGDSRAKCTFTKTSLGWVAEDKGVCFFKDLRPDTPTSLSPLLKCSRHLPAPCLQTKTGITVTTPLDVDGVVSEKITLSGPSGYRAECKRYLQ